mgnify:CR=1 FL=1
MGIFQFTRQNHVTVSEDWKLFADYRIFYLPQLDLKQQIRIQNLDFHYIK